jgi:hypothetical protein
MKRMSGQSSSVFLNSTLFLPVLLFTLAASVPAHAAPNCSTPQEPFLTARLAVWQQRLDLQDWTLTVIPTRARDLKPQTLGHIDWDVDKKTAKVRVLAVSDYDTMACSAALDDMELTVVHELVHLVLSRLRHTGTNFSEEEQAVNQLADALLKLDRQTRARAVVPTAMASGPAPGCMSDPSSAGCPAAHR